MTKTIQGIDVSKWQGVVNFEKVKADGYDFVILNAGYGKYLNQKDPTFERNYESAKAAGLYVGAYWYSYATTVADAKLEADTFLEAIKGKTFEYPVAFDIEDATQTKLSKSLIGDICDAFCKRLESAGYYVCLYSYSSFLANKIPASIVKSYDIWLAEFTNAESPSYRGEYGIWQWNSRGSISGVLGDVDLNRSYKDYPSIMRVNGFNGHPTYELTDYKPGDVNGDGKVNAADITKVAAHIKGKKSLTDDEKKRADVNGDGKVNAADLTSMAARVKGVSSTKSKPTSKPEEEWITHTVVAGDTLWALSKKYGVSIIELARINSIKNANIINVGQVLKIKKK